MNNCYESNSTPNEIIETSKFQIYETQQAVKAILESIKIAINPNLQNEKVIDKFEICNKMLNSLLKSVELIEEKTNQIIEKDKENLIQIKSINAELEIKLKNSQNEIHILKDLNNIEKSRIHSDWNNQYEILKFKQNQNLEVK